MTAAQNPYRIEGPALVSFSGGRTSGYMLWHILDAYGGTLPDDIRVCFANTGKEREETLRFVHECETRWKVPVAWIERERTTGFALVNHNSASRDGEPFAALIAQRQYTPNAVTRFCTTELKIRPMKAYALSLGWRKWANIIGLRADEPSRVQRSRQPRKELWHNVMPLADAGVSNRDVRGWWATQDFDLQLLPFEGNCDGCFLKARPKLWEIERTRPGTLQWWSDMEEGPGKGRFVTEYSYAELIRDVRRQPDLFAGGLFDTDPDMDAECGTWCPGEAA